MKLRFTNPLSWSLKDIIETCTKSLLILDLNLFDKKNELESKTSFSLC